MQDSDPLRYSGIAGGVATAKLICRVIFFCTLFVGRPFWIIFSAPFGGGYPFPALFCAGATGWFGPPIGGGGGDPSAISPGAGGFERKCWGLLPHLHHAFAEFLELA